MCWHSRWCERFCMDRCRGLRAPDVLKRRLHQKVSLLLWKANPSMHATPSSGCTLRPQF